MNNILFYLLRIKIPIFRFLDGQAITNVKSAMKLWEKDTCLRFREYHSASGTSDRIVFVGAQGYVIRIHMYMFAYTVPSYGAIIGASAARFSLYIATYPQVATDPLLNSRHQVCVLRHCIIFTNTITPHISALKMNTFELILTKNKKKSKNNEKIDHIFLS